MIATRSAGLANARLISWNSFPVAVRTDDEGTAWFRAKDVAVILGYANERKAIRMHVDEEDRAKLENIRGTDMGRPLLHNDAQTIYINESGVYSLILRSEMREARAFKRWITSEVLPALRKSGVASQLCTITNETQLHYRVVAFIKGYLPGALLAPGLGELQDTSEKRLDCWRKGYRGGTPDILLLNHHKRYSGMAVELKTPKGTGRLSEKQRDCLQDYSRANFKTLVSCNYDEILWQLIEYFQHLRLCCLHCAQKFKNVEALGAHLKWIHRV